MNSVDDHSKKDYTINSKMIAAIVKEQHVVNSVNIGMIHLNKVSLLLKSFILRKSSYCPDDKDFGLLFQLVILHIVGAI